MSVVIVGGNECMVCQYKKVCKNCGCDAKVFVKERGTLEKKMGCPDLLVLFTSAVSHKMVITAVKEAKRNNIPIARSHSGSAASLARILREHYGDYSGSIKSHQSSK